MQRLPKSLTLFVSILSFGTGLRLAAAQPARRIHDDLRGSRTFLLPGSSPPRALLADDLGPIPEGTPLPQMTLHFRLSPDQQADLAGLLARQRDRHSRDYRKWLTPEQFASRYGLNDGDLERTRHWLESYGLVVTEVARSKTWISFSGAVANVQNAFSTSLHHYSSHGTGHFANRTPISLPAGLNGVAAGVLGLDDFRPDPRISHLSSVMPASHFTSGSGLTHYLTPNDFATIYNVKALYSAGIDGTGQKIAIPGQSDIDIPTVQAFRRAAGLPVNDPQVVLFGDDPGLKSADQDESHLDIEWAGAVAPQATIIFVNSKNVFSSALYTIDRNLAPVLAFSYGSCEANLSASQISSLSSAFQQANAQGITVIAASGDWGVADCETRPDNGRITTATKGFAVDVPASFPNVTGVGGTTFQEGGGSYWAATNDVGGGSALSYIPEVAWNDTAQQNHLLASGGGKSILFPKPSWQVGLNVPADNARDVPDLAFAASPFHDGYIFCTTGNCVSGFVSSDGTIRIVGGASVASPTFAGIAALLNQYTKTAQGNINPGLYSLASLSTDAFHDITQGNNNVPCTAGTTDCPTGTATIGFSAGPGYDQVTGLGSVDAYRLVNEWGTDFDVAITPTALTVNAGRSNTATVQISKVIGFSGVVSFTCAVAPTLTETTCSIPGTVTGSGTATLTVSNSSPAFTPRAHWRLPDLSLGFLLWPGAAFALLLTRRKGGRTLLAGRAALVLLFALSTSCDDGGSSSAASERQRTSMTGNITVTATSGIESHSTTIAVTVP